VGNHWRHELKLALVITRREVGDQLRDWRIILPIIILTLIFPALMNMTARQAVNFVESYGAPIIGDRLIPFLLMIVGFFPISVSLVIALESFVGEKERGSIEPLLVTPLSDWQLYLGKLLAAMAPPLAASFLGIGVYLVGINWQVGWTPPPALLIQVLLLTGVQALVMVSGAVVVSSQTTSVRAANLLASFIIIPMALLIQAESMVMFWARYGVLWWAIAGLSVIAGLLIRSGIAYFNREELLGRELDTLNITRGWSVFWRSFRTSAHTPAIWYRQVLTLTRERLIMPVFVMTVALVIGFLAGMSQASVFALPAEILQMRFLKQGFIDGLEAIRFFSIEGVGLILVHNIRAILLATLLGLFTFGVLGVIILILPFMLIGYVFGNLTVAGLSPGLFLTALVLPHGILEIPAIVLAGAAILRLGATLATPAKGQTIGAALINALADWAKVFVGLVVPLLIGAAFLEVLLTPRVAVWLLGG